MNTEPEHDSEWTPGSGPVAQRTDRCIKALLEWYHKADHVSYIKRQNFKQVINEIGDIHSEDAVDQYVERMVKHGPFERGEGNLWEVNTDGE